MQYRTISAMLSLAIAFGCAHRASAVRANQGDVSIAGPDAMTGEAAVCAADPTCTTAVPANQGDVASAGPDAVTADAAPCEVDPAQTTWGTDFGAVSGPVPQILDAPEAFFQPDAAACAALGIAACRRIAGCGETTYACFDADGKPFRDNFALFQPYSGDSVPCSKAQFAQWLDAEAAECEKKVSIDKLPADALPLVAKSLFPSMVCANASSTRFRLDSPLGSVRVVYWPGACGGNQPSDGWTTCAAPAAADVWSAELPFLKCSAYHDYSSDSYRALDMQSDCATRCVLPTRSYHEGQTPGWSSFFALVAANFKGCPAAGSPP